MSDKCIEGESGPTEEGWHKIETYIRCAKEHQYANVRGIKIPQAEQPDYLAVGSLVHAGRAKWFALECATDEHSLAEVRSAMSVEAYKQKLPIKLDAERKALDIIRAYIDHWGMRAKPKALAVEYKLGPVPFSSGSVVTRTARLDDLSDYPGFGLYIGECKTTSTSIFDTINQYTLHGQVILQLALYAADPNGEAKFGPVGGVMLDVIKKGYGKDKHAFAREPIRPPPAVVTKVAARIRDAVLGQSMVGWDSYALMNPGACTRLIGRARVACAYRDLCMHGRNAALQYVLADGTPLTQYQPVAGAMKMPWE